MNQPLGDGPVSLSLFPRLFMIMGGDQFLPFTWKRRPIQFTWVIVVKNLNLAERNSMVDPNTVFPFCKVIKRFFIRSLQDGMCYQFHLPKVCPLAGAPQTRGVGGGCVFK